MLEKLAEMDLEHENLLGARDYFTELASYQAPFLEEKLLLENEVGSKADYNERFTEFKKYISLYAIYKKPMAMTSPKVDELWHQFILFTREYHSFCQEFVGRYFHHSPNLPSRQGDIAHVKNFVESYRETYGPIPKIWNICSH